MNRIDKAWYKALRFLSRLSLDEYDRFKEGNPKKFRKYMPEDVENSLEQLQYIIFRNGVTNVVTQRGLQQLRDLEEIRRKDLTLIASVIAVVISLVALGFSLFSLFNSV